MNTLTLQKKPVFRKPDWLEDAIERLGDRLTLHAKTIGFGIFALAALTMATYTMGIACYAFRCGNDMAFAAVLMAIFATNRQRLA